MISQERDVVAKGEERLVDHGDHVHDQRLQVEQEAVRR